VQENDRVPATNGDVTHLAVTDAYATTGMIVFGRNPFRHGIAPLAIRGAPGKGGLELIAIPEINLPLESILPALATGSAHIAA
jgi:hypothetical protein